MPDERFLHKRLGHSAKVNSLTDFEFRVWMQYQLSADDCGVLRFNAVTLQADNDALAAKPVRAIQRALDRLVETGLLLWFEHQGQRFVCQGDWQNFQHVRFPRATIHPCPPASTLRKCSNETVSLFRTRHGEHPEILRCESGEVSEETRVPAGAGGREWLTANGNGSSGSREAKDRAAGRAGDFVERYGQLHEKYRNGARYVGKMHHDFQEALQLVQVYDDARLDLLARVWFQADDDFAESGTRTMAKFRSRVSWCEERLIEFEQKQAAKR